LRRRVIAGPLRRAAPSASRSAFQDGPGHETCDILEPRVKVELTYNEMREARLRDPVSRAVL